ncbi:MAG: hypothetical protein HYT65_03585 [Candidatus Yanofskybacteria bacterium]|nr:hypothetical protein [Candidatus Yanofskybacteria bacterium]
MVIKNKIFMVVCIAVLFVFVQPLVTNADVISTRENFVYLFHFYYDNGQLFTDRDAKFKYDIVAEPYAASALKTADPYSGEILNFNNKILATFKFDQSIVKGRMSIKGPYFADASEVNFYDGSNQLLLTIDVSGSSFCNDDEICNSDAGENSDNCSNDCKLKPPQVSAAPIPTIGGLDIKLILIIVGGIAVIAVLAVWFIIKRKRAAAQMPPSLPPTSVIQ